MHFAQSYHFMFLSVHVFALLAAEQKSTRCCPSLHLISPAVLIAAFNSIVKVSWFNSRLMGVGVTS